MRVMMMFKGIRNRAQRPARNSWSQWGASRATRHARTSLRLATIPAPSDIAQRLGLDDGQDVVMRRLRFVVDELPAQLVRVYYEPGLVAGSKLEQPVVIPDGVHAELRRLGVRVIRFVEDFMGARLPTPEEE